MAEKKTLPSLYLKVCVFPRCQWSNLFGAAYVRGGAILAERVDDQASKTSIIFVQSLPSIDQCDGALEAIPIFLPAWLVTSPHVVFVSMGSRY